MSNLVFVELAVLVLLFALFLERDDDEADKDVDHEESNDDDVDEVEDSYGRPMIGQRTVVFSVRVNTTVHQPCSNIISLIVSHQSYSTAPQHG